MTTETLEVLRDVRDALDRALGDSDPYIDEDMTDEDIRSDEPLFYACQRIAGEISRLEKLHK